MVGDRLRISVLCLEWTVIHDELLMVRGFTVDGVDMSLMVHELVKH